MNPRTARVCHCTLPAWLSVLCVVWCRGRSGLAAGFGTCWGWGSVLAMAGSSAWQPRHDDPLFIMAMDHRESFGKTLFDVKAGDPGDAQLAAMKSAKQLIFEGLREAVPMMASGRAGVLVDERYGQEVIDEVVAGGTPVVLAVPVEASGHDWFTLEWADQWLEHVERIKPGYAKVLVRDNPDFNARRRERPLRHARQG